MPGEQCKTKCGTMSPELREEDWWVHGWPFSTTATQVLMPTLPIPIAERTSMELLHGFQTAQFLMHAVGWRVRAGQQL